MEWGTDYWGEVLSEPSEEHARKVAEAGSANLYRRGIGGEWEAAALVQSGLGVVMARAERKAA